MEAMSGPADTVPDEAAGPVPSTARAPGDVSPHRTVAPGEDGGFDRQRAIERVEDRSVLLRTRRILGLTLLMIPLYLGFDWAVTFVEPGPVWLPMAVRAPALVWLGIILLRLHRAEPPSAARLLTIERVTTSAVALSNAACCLVAGGIGSVYAVGNTVILVARSAMRADRWRDALPSIAFAALCHPALLLIAAAFSPDLAGGLREPAQLALFAIFVTLNVLVAGLTLAGGDATWRLRRQLMQERQVGRYRLQRLLGVGGMGEVWAAYFPPLRREVALKILRTSTWTPRTSIARFEREVRATSELTHPNTVRVLDFGVTEDGLWYYAMELLEGETLDCLLRREGPMPPARAAHLVLQAARALVEAHGRGIIHRDIKPDNLFVTAMGGEPDTVKVVDFGIARLARADSGESLTRTGAVAGTPAYMAPELAAGGRADGRSDVYGLGTVLYQALTGQPPFPGHDVRALLAAVLFDPIRPIAEVRGEPIAAELDAIAMRCLARDPDRRYASAADLAQALSSWSLAHRWEPTRSRIRS
jgi:eukaryotic-like serine/threonine-protein kinase